MGNPRYILPAVVMIFTLVPAVATAQSQAYILGSEDVLEVSVWGYPDLTRVVMVGPDGRVTLPLVGTVTAVGISIEHLTRMLSRSYAQYINNPQVTVIVKEFRKIRVSVLGQVARPGTYPLPAGARMLDALGAAGGITEAAALTGQLLRPGQPPQAIDLSRLLAGDTNQNLPLQGGETLVVPEDLVNLVNVVGEVTRPGRYRLKGEMRVLDALLLAGGLTERASVTQARLIRGGNRTQALSLDELLLRQEMGHNIPLQAGDMLIIPEEINNKIYVVGDVTQPGVFTLKGEISLLQAVAMAGGVTQRGAATARNIHIIRRNGAFSAVAGTPRNGLSPTVATTAKVEPLPSGGALLTADLQTLLRGGDAAAPVMVQAGDVVVVPQSGLSGLQAILSILSGILGVFR